MDRLAEMSVFVHVVESGSFSAAAKRLERGQPAISKTVANLEERLGVRLLLRSTRGLSTTEAGQRFYERAKRVVEDADEADRAARGEGQSLAGRLRVSAAVTFARRHIIPQLGPFLDEHPNLEIDFVLDDQHVDLIEEGTDIALRMGPMADSTLKAQRLASRARRVMATPAYWAIHGTPQSPEALTHHRAIVYTRRDSGTHWRFRHAHQVLDITLNPRLRISAAEGIREAVLANLGLTVSNDWMFGTERINGDVVSVLDDWALPALDLWAVYPTTRFVSAKARAFAAFVQHCVTR